METSEKSNISIKLRINGLIQRMFILILLGLVSIISSIVLFSLYHSIIFVVAFFVSIALIWLCAPILGLYTIICIIKNWAAIKGYAEMEEEQQIDKIAGNLLIASFLFVVISIFPKIFINIFGDGTVLRFLWAIVIALTGTVMGCISFKLSARIPGLLFKRATSIFSVILCLVVTAFILFSSRYFDYLIQRYDYSKKIETFSGDSGSLSQTIIVPTLDSPLTCGKNIIWCSSFQLAWNKIKDDVTDGPVQVVGAEELAARLNAAEQSVSDMEPESFYVAAGRIKQGIVDKIKKEMAAEFPSHSVPDFNDIADIPDAILAYSYLIANVPFKYPYRQVENEFFFTDSNGIKTDVSAFGLWEPLKYSHIRDQVEILYCLDDRDRNPDGREKEFVIDLCKNSRPYQVVAAIVEPKESLEKTIEHINTLIEGFKTKEIRKPDFGPYDALIIPEMFWEIDHRFEELINRVVSNADPPMPIVEARQGIKLRLDRHGAMLESEATLKIAAIPRYFRFNRPFLVYMKKRDCEQPFFVMWVDNAELLSKK